MLQKEIMDDEGDSKYENISRKQAGGLLRSKRIMDGNGRGREEV
jgi:hypothetical protein